MKTTSLELSRRLWEAGVREKTLFKWQGDFNCVVLGDPFEEDEVPAYTADGLWPVLPEKITVGKVEMYLMQIKTLDGTRTMVTYRSGIPDIHQDLSEPYSVGVNPAEALGEMVYWLFQNGYLKRKEAE